MNVNFGLFPPLAYAPKGENGQRLRGTEKTLAKKRALTRRALAELERWIAADAHVVGGGIEQMTLPSEIESRWTSGVVLKRDLLSTVERGRFGTPAGEVGCSAAPDR